MPSPRPELIPLIISDVYELAGAFRRNGEQIARSAAQTQARWQVLSAASDPTKTVPQIARRLGVSRQNVQRIAETLVREGFARFTANPDHRTSLYLVATEQGLTALAKLARAASARHATLAARLNGVELGQLRTQLRSVLSALNTLEDDFDIGRNV